MVIPVELEIIMSQDALELMILKEQLSGMLRLYSAVGPVRTDSQMTALLMVVLAMSIQCTRRAFPRVRPTVATCDEDSNKP